MGPTLQSSIATHPSVDFNGLLHPQEINTHPSRQPPWVENNRRFRSLKVAAEHKQAGIVRLLSAGRIERRKVARLSSLGARHLRPCLKRFGTQRTIIDCPEQMTPKAKQIVALAVRAQKSLRMTVRTKASQLPFLLSGMFM